ncbi:MAG: glycoside hydrolase family 3 N-terminal domain-containing protein [Candidatus Melainabacteria bacterium]|nr:glycoside hydrolase family 3 N-terminal domain-containing protein [Candidatus Melainabacteria bacterium]
MPQYPQQHPALAQHWQTLSLQEQVAQRLILGFDGCRPGPEIERFFSLGLGGVIFFRHNFALAEQQQDPKVVQELLFRVAQDIPERFPRPFLSLDQEGGQVERLAHTLFPSLPTPLAIAQHPQPKPYAQQVYQTLAEGLAALGFNLNYAPTLDVNLNPNNPIIGVRAFGSTAQTVWSLGQVALQAHQAGNVIPVIKHFPGHGNGTVDSHESLPTLLFTEEELWPFQQAIAAGAPVVLVSHGTYPALQADEEPHLPASLSPKILQGLLRGRCGFQGVVVTDDLCMGAITQFGDPVSVALQSVAAGMDMLLYRQASQAEWQVLEALTHALEEGRLDRVAHEESLMRIFALKQAFGLLPQKVPAAPAVSIPQQKKLPHWLSDPSARNTQANTLADTLVRALVDEPGTSIQLDPHQPLALIHPDRAHLSNYRFDVGSSPELNELLVAAGWSLACNLVYHSASQATPSAPASPESSVPPGWAETFDQLATAGVSQGMVVTWLPHQGQEVLRALYANQTLAQMAQQWFIVSVGYPADRTEAMVPALWQQKLRWIDLCTYRPAHMQALVAALRGG